MQAKRWIISDCDEEQREILSQQLAVSPYIAEILLKRGIKTYQESIEFLNPQLQNLSHPLEILNMAAAAEKIWQSIEKKEKITKFDLYTLGFIGGSNSSLLRKNLQKHLGLPDLLSASSLLEVLNTMMTKQEFEDLAKKMICFDIKQE